MLHSAPVTPYSRMMARVDGGTYSWKVQADIVHADAVVADLYAIPIEEASNGVPLLRFLQAIHQDDLQRVSAGIKACMENGSPFRCEYRVAARSGNSRPVLAMGHCFRDTDGHPVEYSGMVFDLSSTSQAARLEEEMVESCISAFEAAKKTGNEFVSYLLSMALIEIGEKTASALVSDNRTDNSH